MKDKILIYGGNGYTGKLFARHLNIETYSVFPGFVVSMMKGKLGWLRNLLLHYVIRWLPEGPSDRKFARGKTYMVAKAKNANGEEFKVEISGPEACFFTIECLQQLVDQLRKNESSHGVKSPSFFGTNWIEKIDGVTIHRSRVEN